MATIEHFEDLEVGKLARKLTGKLYGLSRRDPFAKYYGFRELVSADEGDRLARIVEEVQYRLAPKGLKLYRRGQAKRSPRYRGIEESNPERVAEVWQVPL